MLEPERAARLSWEADEPLPLTGERTAPGIPEENYWFQRHVIAYEHAAGLIRGGRVLDAGCGDGYGSAILATRAAEVVGVDLEPDVIRRAAARYPSARFEVANLVSLPYDDASFDAIVSLQVIEHLHTPHEFLGQCARLLTPGGVLVLSTPNRLTFSPQGTRNPFHAFEFSPSELSALAARHFPVVQLLGTFHRLGARAREVVLRRSLPERLLAQPAYEWPDWLKQRVARVTPRDFRVRTRALDRSLDLIAVARA